VRVCAWTKKKGREWGGGRFGERPFSVVFNCRGDGVGGAKPSKEEHPIIHRFFPETSLSCYSRGANKESGGTHFT